MQIERIVTWDGVIYKAEKTDFSDGYFHGSSCVQCDAKGKCHFSEFECRTFKRKDMNNRHWKRIGTMPNGAV
jgi:hypothetical protein